MIYKNFHIQYLENITKGENIMKLKIYIMKLENMKFKYMKLENIMTFLVKIVWF